MFKRIPIEFYLGTDQGGDSLGYSATIDPNFLALLIDRDHVEELVKVLKAGEVMGNHVAHSLRITIESIMKGL